MDNEKKEIVTPPQAEAKKEEPQPTQAAQPSQPALDVSATKESIKTSPKIEKPANCASCNKSIRSKRWYYRNGKFFCTKRCWKTTVKKEETKEGAQGENK